MTSRDSSPEHSGGVSSPNIWCPSTPLEITPVILSEAKNLVRWTRRFFASLRMTGGTARQPPHMGAYLQMPGAPRALLADMRNETGSNLDHIGAIAWQVLPQKAFLPH